MEEGEGKRKGTLLRIGENYRTKPADKELSIRINIIWPQVCTA